MKRSPEENFWNIHFNNVEGMWKTRLDRNELLLAKLNNTGCSISSEMRFSEKNLKLLFVNFGLNYEKKTGNRIYIEDKVTQPDKKLPHGYSEYLMVLGNSQSYNKIYIYIKIQSDDTPKAIGLTKAYYFETSENFSINNEDDRAFMDQIYNPFTGRPDMTEEQYNALMEKEVARRLQETKDSNASVPNARGGRHQPPGRTPY